MFRGGGLGFGILAWLVVLLSACGADGTDTGGPGAVISPRAPVLTFSPSPGRYQAYTLDVTVRAPDSSYGLYFGVNEAPVVSPERRFEGSFSVRLVTSTQLQVIVEDDEGNRFGPMVHEYVFERVSTDAWCELVTPPERFFKTGVAIPLSVRYRLPVALSYPELSIDGQSVPLSVDDFAGQVTAQVGPFDTDREHRAQCLVRLPGGSAHVGNAWDFVVDGTPPEIAWKTTGFSFDRDTWKNALLLEASDGLAGLERVEMCNPASEACLALAAEPELPGVYTFATALTEGTSSLAQLQPRAVDRSGNERTAAPKNLDLTAFAGMRQVQEPEPIVMRTESVFDLTGHVGEAPSEVRLLHVDGWEPYTGSLHDIALASGWNEFAYRRYGRHEWETHAVYHAGLAAVLPGDRRWLVYASNATSPAGEWRPVEDLYLDAGGEYARDWFNIPHLLFVEDVDGDGRWSTFDRAFTDPTDRFAGVDDAEPWRSRGAPLSLTPLALAPQQPDYVREMTVTVEGGVDASRLVFEWRSERFGFPVSHVTYDDLAFPAAVSVPASGYCTFYADDVTGVRADGILSKGEARNTVPCWVDEVNVATRPGPFSVVDIGESAPLGSIFVVMTGVSYGSLVTGEIRYRAPGNLSDAGVVASYAVTADFEEATPGAAWLMVNWRYPLLDAEVVLWNEGEALAPQYFSTSAASTCSACGFEVSIEDEAGLPAPALVYVGDTVVGRSDATGTAYLDEAPAVGSRLHAFRQNRLLEKRSITEATEAVVLRMLETSDTLGGRVVDQGGTPVRGAVVRWNNNGYLSESTSDDEGYFSLPVSGDTGEVSMAHDDLLWSRTVTAGAWVEFTLPRERNADDPRGMVVHQGAPDRVCAEFSSTSACAQPAPATLVEDMYQEPPYWSLVTTASMPGAWWADWEGVMARAFLLPGLLPALAAPNLLPFVLPGGWGLQMLAQEARCGQWRQASLGIVLAQGDCWSWVAHDEYQTYILANLNTLGAPKHTGLGYLSAVAEGPGGVEPPDQVLVFEELLLGRSIVLPVRDGQVVAALPYGVYSVRTQAGQPVSVPATGNRVYVSAVGSSWITLKLP